MSRAATTTLLFALVALLVLPGLAAPLRFRRADADTLRPRDLDQAAPTLSLRQIGKIVIEGRAGPGPVVPSPEPTKVVRSPEPEVSVQPKVALRDVGKGLLNKLEQRAGSVPPPAARAVPDTGKPTISLRELGSNLLDKVERRAGFVPPQARRAPASTPSTPTVSLREVGSSFLEKLERRAGYVPPQARRSHVDTPKVAEKPAARSIIAADKCNFLHWKAQVEQGSPLFHKV
ncbi:hypothetical protein BDZ94DRAFT_1237489 [Collybia nuda]|uniref:Uncharacterized protein n=1 Tax=Collybia nuda TaxID=64659 RepID=A0A9P5Y1K7_9AGAR|nr:hypothetical protein BDZ94DRAFT_1237489 [Collybia nuda]